MRYLKYLIFVIPFFCIVDTSMAEPTPNIKYLMNEPVSMLDWGIYRLDKYLANIHIDGARSIFYWTDYDGEKNALYLNFTMEINGKSRDEAKKMGESLVSRVRHSLGVNPDTGKPYGGNSRLYVYFSHNVSEDNKEPKGIESELENITVIQLLIMADEGTKGLKCQAPLLGTQIMFDESVERGTSLNRGEK
jgi:hypothetical protein